jgi:hypothetical protein
MGATLWMSLCCNIGAALPQFLSGQTVTPAYIYGLSLEYPAALAHHCW